MLDPNRWQVQVVPAVWSLYCDRLPLGYEIAVCLAFLQTRSPVHIVSDAYAFETRQPNPPLISVSAVDLRKAPRKTHPVVQGGRADWNRAEAGDPRTPRTGSLRKTDAERDQRLERRRCER